MVLNSFFPTCSAYQNHTCKPGSGHSARNQHHHVASSLASVASFCSLAKDSPSYLRCSIPIPSYSSTSCKQNENVLPSPWSKEANHVVPLTTGKATDPFWVDGTASTPSGGRRVASGQRSAKCKAARRRWHLEGQMKVANKSNMPREEPNNIRTTNAIDAERYTKRHPSASALLSLTTQVQEGRYAEWALIPV